MQFTASALRIVALAAAATATPAEGNVHAPARTAETATFKTLLVQFREDKVAGASALSATARGAAATVHGKVTHTYHQTITGCAIQVPAATAAASARLLSADPGVQWVEEDKKLLLADPDVQWVEEDKKTQAAYSWGLDRVDQCALPLDGSGSPLTKVDATGVRVYILDSGIYKDHDEFVGMIDPDSGCHRNFSNDSGGPFADGQGHGTHVAGTACGLNYGVATCDTLCAVKVFDNEGIGSTSSFIFGLEHALGDCVVSFPARAERKCVLNYSAGGEYSRFQNSAVAKAVDAGLWVVVAAGNYGVNAFAESPASEPRAITVASTEIDDIFSWFSNYGDSVDVYAPGSGIVSAGIGGADEMVSLDGTSFASPHVAGIAAGILRKDASADVEAVLKANAQMIGTHQGYPMLLANTVDGGCGGIPPTSPTTCAEDETTIKVAITTDQNPAETSYKIEDQEGYMVAFFGDYTLENTYLERVHCLPIAVYTFTIEDTHSNGFDDCYGYGSYRVFMDGIEEASGSGASFTDSESTTIPNTPSPTTAPTTSSPTGAPILCDQMTIIVAITTDDYPEETYYTLIDQEGNLVAIGFYDRPNRLEQRAHCLPMAVYTFNIYDTYGNGLDRGYGFGTYQVFVDGVVEASGPRDVEWDAESTTIGRDGAAYHTLGSGECAAPVRKREQCKRAGSHMAMDWKGAISNPKKPGGCVVTKGEVAFNTEGEKGIGCKPGAQCVCTVPYALEEGKCAKPLTKPLTKSACEEAVTVWGGVVTWKGLIGKTNRPRGCFVDARRNRNGQIIGGEVFFNKKGKKGTKCTQDMPCVCSV